MDPTVVADPLYVRDTKSGTYRRLDRAVHAQLIEAASGSELKLRKIAGFPESGPFTNDAERSPAAGPVWHFSEYHCAKRCNEKASAIMSAKLTVISAMKQIAAEQRVILPPLHDDLSLHETGFDSLVFAIPVARLEGNLGIDPFTVSDDVAFPQTVGDFVRA
jgi:hypothetical protein